jgi:GNAT superfamily N-acetyltransferase
MPDAVFADAELAARLENGVASDLATFADAAALLDPALGSEVMNVGGGVALYVSPGSPVNQAAGLGFAGPVAPSDIDRLEAFFEWHAGRAVVLASPLAHPSLFRLLGERGYRVAAFENTLVRPLPADEELPLPDPAIGIRPALTAEERAVYARTVVEGFTLEGAQPTDAERLLGRIASLRTNAALLLAYVDGEPVGTGELTVRDGLGWLNADTTLPAFRGRGVQRSLQRARLALAREAGCDLAVTDARPGSASQRNMERLGFRVAYTRVEFVRQR